MTPLRLGILGFSAGNGHPFSFSAIINGYDPAAMRAAGWDGICDYLDQQDSSDFGIPDVRVTAAWMPDPAMTEGLLRASRIDRAMTPEEMLGAVDAVIVARDDWQTHLPLAMPFLAAGKAVFVDKPLTLDPAELQALRPYLENGQLMSCSGLRFARELDSLRARPGQIGQIKVVSATVLNDLERYGIHLLEAASTVLGEVPKPVAAHAEQGSSYALLRTSAGTVVSLHTLGQSVKRFRLSFFGDQGLFEADLYDNFSAFRRCMHRFVEQVRTGKPAIAPADTIALMETVIDLRGRLGAATRERVSA